MGFKKRNYEVKKLGIVIPQAYAIIENLTIRGEYARADFIIQTSRPATAEKEPIERVGVEFILNREESPFITAYNTAKSQYETEVYNEETGEYDKVVVNQPFYDWEDDYQ